MDSKRGKKKKIKQTGEKMGKKCERPDKTGRRHMDTRNRGTDTYTPTPW